MHISKSNFCQAYSVNSFEEQAENQSVARLNIRGIPFGSYKSIECETAEILKLILTLVILCDQFCVKKNQEFPQISHKQQGGTS